MILEFFKKVYTKAYVFWGVQLFAFIIIFFVLDDKTGGGFFSRVFTFLFCVLVGGGLTSYWARKNDGDKVVSFRRGAGTFLMLSTLLLWANNGYKPASSNGGSYFSYPKSCKGGCGYEITSSTNDCNGYHCTCVPGKDGESMYDKARRY